MFTQPCFIKKNTKELRAKLSDFGLELNHGKAWGTYLCTFYLDGDMKFVASLEYDLKNNPSYNISYDCGTNEELFLALAALRDDTDDSQWFVRNDDKDFWTLCHYNEFHCFRINPSDVFEYEDIANDFHKASVEEIIEHFKEK